VDIEKEKAISSKEQTIRNTIENYIMRENFDNSGLSNYDTQ
jgi:hypothetical protein